MDNPYMVFLYSQDNNVVRFFGDMRADSSLRVSIGERGLDIFSFEEGVYQESLTYMHTGVV